MPFTTTLIRNTFGQTKSDIALFLPRGIHLNGTLHVSKRRASHSSHSWVERQKNDLYKRMQRYHNYRARSAFKLIEIDDKYKFLKPNSIVIEAGASPGSWTQVICERLGLDGSKDQNTKEGMCVSLDIAQIHPVPGAICLGNADFTSPFTQSKILTWLNGRKADCVLSDMAPPASGQKFFDHETIVNLIRKFQPFAFSVLKEGSGVFLFKLWDGSGTETLLKELRTNFSSVKIVKPKASRDDSAEIFVICRGFRANEDVTKRE